MYDLSMRCWSSEPRDRPTFAQVNDELQILPAILRNTPAEESRGNRRGGGAHGGYESEASYQASAPGGGGGGGGLGARGGHVREEEGADALAGKPDLPRPHLGALKRQDRIHREAGGSKKRK